MSTCMDHSLGIKFNFKRSFRMIQFYFGPHRNGWVSPKFGQLGPNPRTMDPQNPSFSMVISVGRDLWSFFIYFKKNLSSSRKASRFSLSITGDVLCFQVLGEGTCCNQKSLRKSVLDFLINIVTWIIVVHNPVSVSAVLVASSSEKWNKHLSSRSRTVTRRPMGLQFTWPSLIVRVSRRDVSDFQNLCS